MRVAAPRGYDRRMDGSMGPRNGRPIGSAERPAGSPAPGLSQLTSNGGPLQAPARPRTIADCGEAGPLAAGRPTSLYLHVPFCVHKCHYCDFYSVVDRRDRQGAWVDRAIEEIGLARPAIERGGGLGTIFAGGGTPTLLSPEAWMRLGAALAELPREPDCEFTVEANPETLTPELAETLVAAGVGRLSIGCQSFDRRHLATLERHHDPESVVRAVRIARAAGIRSLSLDLIFGIPGQSLAEWSDDLDQALALAPDHLSCYGLVYELGTPLRARLDEGLIEPASEDEEAEMFDLVRRRLAAEGFEQYEVSNWARPGAACRHNLAYWRGEEWWPIGPAAAGHAAGWRWRNAPRLDDWLRPGGFAPVTDVEAPEPGRAAGEAFLTGLRLLEGLPLERVARLLDAPGGEDRRRAIDRFAADGLLEEVGGRLRLSDRGLPLGDLVLRDLV